jgi:hypothetical protein
MAIAFPWTWIGSSLDQWAMTWTLLNGSVVPAWISLQTRLVRARFTEKSRVYRRKFKVKFISPVQYGLSFFDDVESEPVPHLFLIVRWKTIKKTNQNWVKVPGKITHDLSRS